GVTCDSAQRCAWMSGLARPRECRSHSGDAICPSCVGECHRGRGLRIATSATGVRRRRRFQSLRLVPNPTFGPGCRVTFWDLADPVAPKEIEAIAIECHEQKAGSVGIANVGSANDQRWYVATCDNGLVSVYKASDFPHQSFAFEFACKLSHSYES